MTKNKDHDSTHHLDRPENTGYLAKHGATLLDNGYTIVPIRPGKKAPGFDGWQNAKATKDQLREWVQHGHRMSGVGILTKNTPAIDIDVRDDDVAAKLSDYVRKKMGGTLFRVGRAPKCLFLFRTDEPFRKMRTSKRVDEWGDEQQIEVLGNGQQFVAYHKHPDTGKPYTWPEDGLNPLEVRASELPTVTIEQIEGLMAYFEELADAEDWKLVKKGHGVNAGVASGDEITAIMSEDTRSVDLSDEEIRSRLLLIPDPDADYDQWLQIGMALYHQWDGEQPGLQFWHEWSETGDKYDADALDRKWEDFGIQGKKRAPVTARLILQLSKEAVANTTAELSLKLRDAFQNATDLAEWEKAKEQAKLAEIDGLARSSLAQVAKERRDAITGTKTSLVEVKKAIAYTPKNEKTPGWARNWVYDISDDRFYNTSKKIACTQQGFNAMYNREALTKKDALEGRSNASNNASDLVLNVYKVHPVAGRRYEPGRDAIFTDPDGRFANTYPEHEIPEKPEKILPRDKKNVQRVKGHIAHLLRDPREQRMFLDWLAWVVQNPGKHANYAVLLQGVEGDGKTFFAEMLRAVMGVSNVTMLNAHIFESDFTDWSVGQCVACVEEVRLIKAANKYEVINRIKPIITNRIIEVHPKGKAPHNAKNTTSYLLFSNFKDALPLDDDGRRFLVLFSQWQRRSAIDKFVEENPTYYEELYNAIDVSPGAIRQWLLDHGVSEDFKPFGNAPKTAARTFMVRQAKPEFIRELEDMIESNKELMVSDKLVNVTALSELLMARGCDVPANKSMQSMMQRYGYEDLGKHFVMGGRSTFYTKSPEIFSAINDDGTVSTDRMKLVGFLNNRKTSLDDDEL